MDKVGNIIDESNDETKIKSEGMRSPCCTYNSGRHHMGHFGQTLLFLKLLSDTLTNWGFILNPCNKCVANTIIKIA